MKNCTSKDHLPWIIGLAFAARSSWPLFRNLKLFLDEMFQRNALDLAVFLEYRHFVAFFIVVSLKYLAKHKPFYFWRVSQDIGKKLLFSHTFSLLNTVNKQLILNLAPWRKKNVHLLVWQYCKGFLTLRNTSWGLA